MMTTSLFSRERGEEVFSEAQLPAKFAKGVGCYFFSYWDSYIKE
jgi:hypothetical protein